MARFVRVRTPELDEELVIECDEFWVTDKGELAIAGTMSNGEVITVAQFATYTSVVMEEVPDDGEEEEDDEDEYSYAASDKRLSAQERLAQLDAGATSLPELPEEEGAPEEATLDVPEPSANGHYPLEALRPVAGEGD